MTEMNSEMVQKGLSIILLISIMHACHSPENKNIPVQEDGDAIKNETNLRIQQIKEKSSSVFTSSKGYWEAVLENEMTMVYIPGGNFFMGTDLGIKIEQPMHQVYLDGYWIGKYPVTVGQFREFIEATVYVTDAEKGMGSWQWTGEIPGKDDNRDPWRPMPDGAWNNIYFEQGEDHPVGSVSWNDAIAYCRWLTENTGMPFVLPSEAQWEKAARGTDKRTFPWGNDLPDGSYTNIADKSFVSKYGPYTRIPDTLIDDGYIETSPVDAFPKGQSSYGVYDMAGNLGHWVYDVFDPDYYQNSPTRNPIGPESSVPDVDRVNRGGAWTDRVGVDINGELISPEHGHTIRSAMRTGDEQNSSDDHMGFRVAIDYLRQSQIR